MILSVLEHLNRGNSVSELDDAIKRVVNAVTMTGKSGEVTLKIGFKPSDKAGSDVLLVYDQISFKEPQPDRAAAIFYVDPQSGELVRKDPRQRAMEFEQD